MAELKTKKSDDSVVAFIDSIEDETKREDAWAIHKILSEVTGDDGAMWGTSIIGFGKYHYTYESGREGDWFEVGFSPRKQNLTLYIVSGFDAYADHLAQLGKHSTGKSCLYIKRLSDVDQAVLRQLATESVSHVRAQNG